MSNEEDNVRNSSTDEEVPSVEEFEEESEKKRERRSRRQRDKIKSYTSLASFIFYLGFIIIWLFFFAEPFGPFENLGIMLGLFLLICGFLGVMWTPRDTAPSPGRIYFSIIAAILWLVFIVVWLPFADRILLDQNTLAKNLAVIIGSTTLFLGSIIGTWMTWVPKDVGLGRRLLGTGTAMVIWLGFIVYWLWFQADGIMWNVNAVYLFLSAIVWYLITIGIWIPLIRTQEEGPGYFGMSLFFVWLLIMIIWYQFFAIDFTDYQNIAVFLASFIGIAAIGAVKSWNDWKYRRLDSFDWNDD